MMKGVNTRKRGRKLEKLEEAIWKQAGWKTELVRPEARYIGPGKVVTGYRDFFGKYDLIAASPELGIVVFVQVSTESPSSHGEPLGFSPPHWGERPPPVDVVLTAPVTGTKAFRGVFEVYSYWRKIKGKWEPSRRWWTK